MKRLLFGFFALVLIGAGCSASGDDTTTGVSGTDNDPVWWLTFDLPEGWVRVAHYGGGTQDILSDESIEARSTDIVLQSTAEPISIDGQVSENWEQYTESDYTYIRAFRYSTLRPLPDDAVDLGNGFYSADWYGETGYWFPQEFGNYLFLIDIDGQDLETAKEVIFSAQEYDLSDQL